MVGGSQKEEFID